MKKIIKTVSFFLKNVQNTKDFSINKRNNILYVSCFDKKDTIRELYDFIRFDYNPYHKNVLIPTLENDFLLLIEVKQ